MPIHYNNPDRYPEIFEVDISMPLSPRQMRMQTLEDRAALGGKSAQRAADELERMQMEDSDATREIGEWDDDE